MTGTLEFSSDLMLRLRDGAIVRVYAGGIPKDARLLSGYFDRKSGNFSILFETHHPLESDKVHPRLELVPTGGWRGWLIRLLAK